MEDKIFYKEYQLEFEDFGETPEDEAFASVALNKQFNYVKFILTDDKPNGNNQRVPIEEFENLIKTGIYAPFKMASGKIRDGHDESIPLGVITHLVQKDNQIRGISALWSRERPEDVELLKQAYASKKPLNVSWEINYSEERVDETGITDLIGTSLKAATIVGLPAYEGRTPIIAVASKDKEDLTLEELEQLKVQFAELETKYNEAIAQIETLKAQETELIGLREYKASIDAEKAKAEKLSAIKTKFSEAGLAKDETYFETNQELLFGLSEAALDFMIQEMVSFASTAEPKESKSSKVPAITSDLEEDLSDPKKLGEALRKRLSK